MQTRRCGVPCVQQLYTNHRSQRNIPNRMPVEPRLPGGVQSRITNYLLVMKGAHLSNQERYSNGSNHNEVIFNYFCNCIQATLLAQKTNKSYVFYISQTQEIVYRLIKVYFIDSFKFATAWACCLVPTARVRVVDITIPWSWLW